jgi:hypothetical protein
VQQLLSRTALHGFGTVRPRLRGMLGLGNGSSSSSVTTSEANGIASGITNIAKLAASGAPLSTQIEGSVGSALLAAAPFAGPAAPFLIIGGAICDMLAVLGVGSGCGQTCVLSSNYANQAEALLQQNIAAYFNIPAPRPQSAQAAALANFQAMWNDLEAQCGVASLGSAGQKCITDRQAGACTWKQTAAALPPWGTPPVGACWNWFAGYRDPIANDPAVPDAVASTAGNAVATTTTDIASLSTSAGSQISTALGLPSTTSPYLVPGLIAAGILLFAVGGGD